MRIIRYSSQLQLEPWMTFDLVPLREVRENEVPSKQFDKIVAAVKAAGFSYTVVDQPGETLIERADQQSTSGDDK